ncbi:MAG: hypothetical protein OEO79_03490 [Gemmatimonadota bacterium]|nr:hypothetical protein [Gemmatimonadota bacterium]
MDATTLRLALLCAFVGAGVEAQDGAQNPVHTHIRHAADAYADTPAGMGLLATAQAEAEVAAQHAALGAADLGNLDGMRRHAGHVIHALDPSVVAGGPGLGYGVKRAAQGAAQHIELALASDSVSENVTVHAGHVLASLGNVVRWTDDAVALARRVQAAASVTAAASLVAQLDALCSAIFRGQDMDGDGRVGWQDGEGGLAQATQHTNLMKRGEDI